MSLFPPYDLGTMNEDDVAGEIVRPFCRALGYTQGNPDANMRSQISIQYDKVFLGHKNAGKDPVLRGRPDFVCEVVSYARWVIEAKAPHIELSQDDSNQAHTYATHPEIHAEYYVLTNGREFRLYRVGKPYEPVWTWKTEDTEENLPALKAFLGPTAMKKRANIIIDKGKPLAQGLSSNVKIVGGHVVYLENYANFTDASNMNGLVNAVNGSRIFRTDEGLIYGEVDLKSAFSEMDDIFSALGLYPLKFETAEEYISSEIEKPTLFQGLLNIDFPPGTSFPKTPISPGGVIPIRIKASAYVEVTGFLQEDVMKGTFAMNCDYDVPEATLFGLRADLSLLTAGTFEIKLV